MERTIKKIMSGLVLSALLTIAMSGTVARATSYDWYLYYNDENNKVELCDWKFTQFGYHKYTATPYTSANHACTLIQPGYGTTLKQPSYACMSAVVRPEQISATGNYAHIRTVLSLYNSKASSTTGNLHD